MNEMLVDTWCCNLYIGLNKSPVVSIPCQSQQIISAWCLLTNNFFNVLVHYNTQYLPQ